MTDRPTTPLLGLDFSRTIAGTSTAGAGAPLPLGMEVDGTNGSRYIFVQASVAINQYDAVTWDNTLQAQGATPATLGLGNDIGFAQVAFAQYDFGWVAQRGDALTVNVSATSTLTVALYIATTTGKLSTTASSGTLAGVVLQTASTTAIVSTCLAICTWPKNKTL